MGWQSCSWVVVQSRALASHEEKWPQLSFAHTNSCMTCSHAARRERVIRIAHCLCGPDDEDEPPEREDLDPNALDLAEAFMEAVQDGDVERLHACNEAAEPLFLSLIGRGEGHVGSEDSEDGEGSCYDEVLDMQCEVCKQLIIPAAQASTPGGGARHQQGSLLSLGWHHYTTMQLVPASLGCVSSLFRS
jgi:hypothetical protein